MKKLAVVAIFFIFIGCATVDKQAVVDPAEQAREEAYAYEQKRKVLGGVSDATSWLFKMYISPIDRIEWIFYKAPRHMGSWIKRQSTTPNETAPDAGLSTTENQGNQNENISDAAQ